MVLIRYWMLLVAIAAAPAAEARAPWLRDVLTTSPPEAARAALQHFTAHTPFEQRWAVNAPDAADSTIVLFWLSENLHWPDAPRKAQQYRGRCAVVPDELSIVCDGAFAARYQAEHSLYPVGATDGEAFIWWCIGHELAHIVLGDNFDRPRLHTARVASELQQRIEYRADCWYIRHLRVADDADRHTSLVVMATNLINGELAPLQHPPVQGAGIIFDYRGAKVYDFLSTGTHPTLVLRAARLLQVSLRHRDDAGVRAMLEPFARVLLPDSKWGLDSCLSEQP